jgi:hypothetical protein
MVTAIRVIAVTWAVMLTVLSGSAQALILPPDPFDATDRYALLLPAVDGTITQIQAKVSIPAGPGVLIAEVRYQQGQLANGYPAQYVAMSRPIPLETLTPGAAALITFDFSDDPLPPSAHHRALALRVVPPDGDLPLTVVEYPGERLLLRPAGAVIRTDLAASQTAAAGQVVVGPLTVVRERGMPQTETVRFDVQDPNGVFWLRLTNGETDGQGRVAAAVVTLNGQEVFRPAAFNRRVAGLTRQLTVQPGENVLAVTVRSEPGASVTLEVVREDGRVCRALGPHTFVRATGKPVTEELTFALLPQLTGPFTLQLTNGDGSGAYRVDSGVITLNGQQIVSGSDFNEQIATISRTVTLQALNTLRVELAGAPSDRLTLEITGFDNVPPHVTITSPAPGAVVSAGPITVTGVVDDPSATVTVNSVVATVNPDGTFTAEGVPLQEGDNVLTVVATDSCGNHGEATVTVRLQTAPVGPELQFCAEEFREQIPHPPSTECLDRERGFYDGFVTGITDETAVSITINGVLMPDGVLVRDQGDVFFGMREGTWFWAFVTLPPPDGEHAYTAVVTDAQGQSRSATVYFLRDTVDPVVVITSPANNTAVNTTTVTLTGTVDDPEVTSVRVGFTTQFPVIDGQFTATASLAGSDGFKTVFVQAVDLTGNIGGASLRLILDRVPPVLTVTTPTEAAAVNTPTLPMSGTVTDRTGGVPVTVAVNGQLPTSMVTSGSNFSGAVMLAPGANTLEVVATDAAGNVSRVTRSVLLDLVPPTVQITEPTVGAALTGQVTVTAAATDDASGIVQVRLLVDGQGTTLTTAPYSFSLDTLQVASGSRVLIVQATDRAGNLGEASMTVDIQPQLSLQITSPTNGSTVLYSPILVQGTIVNNYGPSEIGITVNGYVAETQGGKFAVDGVAVSSGANTLTATATDGAGVTAAASGNVTVVSDQSSRPVTLTAEFPSSLAPIAVTFTADTALPNPITSYRVDFEGDGVVDSVSSTWNGLTHTYTTPGLYVPTLIVIDSSGQSYSASTVVNVLDPAAINGLLQAKWQSMRQALAAGDVDHAVGFFVGTSQDRYRRQFLALTPYLSQIVADMGAISNLLDLDPYHAEYALRRTEPAGEFSYGLIFSRDEQGIWRIQWF